MNIVEYKGARYAVLNKEWFEGAEAYSIKHDERNDEVIITKHYLEQPRNAVQGSVKFNQISFYIPQLTDIPLGEYAVDTEDSDEDTLIIPLY